MFRALVRLRSSRRARLADLLRLAPLLLVAWATLLLLVPVGAFLTPAGVSVTEERSEELAESQTKVASAVPGASIRHPARAQQGRRLPTVAARASRPRSVVAISRDDTYVRPLRC